MWPICGSENIIYDQCFEGNTYENMPGISGWTWRRKKRAWSNLTAQILCPSTWLAECVKQSQIFCNQAVDVLPNGLNLDVFKPADRDSARLKCGFPLNKKLVLFGAADPRNFNKGGDLLRAALELLNTTDVEVAVFGADGDEKIAGLPTCWLGYIHDAEELAELYSAADVVCVPSRVETFGQTASEPQACGVPVVAFDTTGLKDVIEHKVTGYLATPFDVTDFARGIEWVLGADRGELSRNARERAERLFDEQAIAKQCKKIYERVLARAVV